MLQEKTPSVSHSLHLGEDENGDWRCACASPQAEGFDPKPVAENLASMMDASRVQRYFDLITGSKELE